MKQDIEFVNIDRFPDPKPQGYEEGWILNGESEKKAWITTEDVMSSEDGWSDQLSDIHVESTKSSWIDIQERDKVLKIISGFKEIDDPVVVEFGACHGYVLEEIRNLLKEKNGTFVATDLMASGLKNSYDRNPDIMHIRCDFVKSPFVDSSVDIVYALNVLEHISDDIGAISEAFRVLKKGGYCVFVVPYGRKLYDYFDEALFHKRRYDRKELCKKCEDSGFSIIDDFYLGWIIYPIFWIKKRSNQLFRKNMSDNEKFRKAQGDISHTTNNFASTVWNCFINVENFFERIFKPSFGIREIVVCRKK
ncbi:MAG: class I SAM-dependent methyltransferase [Lachnospiraceae bacterium]|nr:class I SAM-dependent methyltransferase [Lachnospiraceae bacterium]